MVFGCPHGPTKNILEGFLAMEAGSSKSKSIFFANRVDGAVVGQPGRARSAQGVQSKPARATRAPRSSHSRPDRTSQGEPEAPRASKSSQPGRPGLNRGSQGAPSRPAQTPDPQAVEQFRYGYNNNYNVSHAGRFEFAVCILSCTYAGARSAPL